MNLLVVVGGLGMANMFEMQVTQARVESIKPNGKQTINRGFGWPHAI